METAKIDNVDKDDEAYEDTPDAVYGIKGLRMALAILRKYTQKEGDAGGWDGRRGGANGRDCT